MPYNEIIATLVPISFVPSVILYYLSAAPKYGVLRLSALHPFNVLGFLIFVVALDFASLWSSVASGEYVRFASFTIGSLDVVLSGLATFVTYSFAAVMGCTAAAFSTSKRVAGAPAITDRAAMHTYALFLLAGGVMASIFVLTSLSAGSLFYIASIRQIFFRDNQLLVIIFGCIAPSFILFAGTRIRTRTLLIAALVTTILLIPTGSRGPIFYIILSLGLHLVVQRNIRLRAVTIYLFSPILVLLTLVLRYLRESGNYASFEQFVEYGPDLLFSGQDLSMAEPLAIVSSFEVLPRYPFESFVAGVLAFVPRSAISWKPEGASTAFTRLADPARWDLVKSEWVVTGFGNLRAEFGFVGGVVVTLLMFFVWANALPSGRHVPQSSLIFGAGVACISAYLFMRGDLYIVSFFLWPSIIVYITGRLFNSLQYRRNAMAGSMR